MGKCVHRRRCRLPRLEYRLPHREAPSGAIHTFWFRFRPAPRRTSPASRSVSSAADDRRPPLGLTSRIRTTPESRETGSKSVAQFRHIPACSVHLYRKHPPRDGSECYGSSPRGNPTLEYVLPPTMRTSPYYCGR